MTKQLTKKQYCFLFIGNIEIWVDEDKAENYVNALNNKTAARIAKIEGRFVNTQSNVFIGAFLPEDLERRTRLNNHQWQCKDGNWHDRSTECDCYLIEKEKKANKVKERYEKCRKCNQGYILKKTEAGEIYTACECIKGLI